MPTSYNGWPASRNPAEIRVNREWEPIPGVRYPGGVKAGDVEVVFTYLVVQLDARVEPADIDAQPDDWGFAYKASANSPELLSCHSSATAIDYNARRHPNRVRGTWTDAQRAEIGKILNELDGVIRWLALKADGGSASRTPDEMHFEIRGDAAAVKAVADRIRNQQPTPEPGPLPQEDDGMCLYEVTAGPDGGTVWLVAGNRRRVQNQPSAQHLIDGGIPYRMVDDEAWAQIAAVTYV